MVWVRNYIGRSIEVYILRLGKSYVDEDVSTYLCGLSDKMVRERVTDHNLLGL